MQKTSEVVYNRQGIVASKYDTSDPTTAKKLKFLQNSTVINHEKTLLMKLMTDEQQQDKHHVNEIMKNFTPKIDTILLKLQPDCHGLSAEEQAYFLKITEGIFGYYEQIRNETVKILCNDYNVKVLAPYLCEFIKNTIHFNIAFADLTLLIYTVRMTKGLLSNPYVNLKPYLHNLIPALLSCVLAKKISKYHHDNHWTLRDFSAYIVAMICNIYGNKTNNITERVTNVYLKPFKDSNAPLTTIYGALKGLSSLGDEHTKTYIIPNIKTLSNKIYIVLEKNSGFPDENRQQINEAVHVRDAVSNIVGPILLKSKYTNDGGLDYVNEFGYLGQALYIQIKNLEKIEMDRKLNYLRQPLENLNSAMQQNCVQVLNFTQNIYNAESCSGQTFNGDNLLPNHCIGGNSDCNNVISRLNTVQYRL